MTSLKTCNPNKEQDRTADIDPENMKVTIYEMRNIKLKGSGMYLQGGNYINDN